MSKIGIYISAFDPIHEGDLEFAKAAITQTSLDKVYFFIEPRPKYKQGVKALEHRVHMVVLAVKHDPEMGTIIVKAPSTSEVDIAKILNKRFQNHTVSLILSEDMVGKLDNWTWLKLGKLPLNLAIGIDKMKKAEIKVQVSLMQNVFGVPINYTTFNITNPTKLSGTVRRKLKLGLKPKEVPELVYDYIKTKNLYASRSNA